LSTSVAPVHFFISFLTVFTADYKYSKLNFVLNIFFSRPQVTAELKPCLLFSGEAFEKSDEMKRLKSLLIDFFRGPEVPNVSLAGLEHALQFTSEEGQGGGGNRIYVRSYKIALKKSDTPKVPR
jgi:hypothetical protein